MRRIGSMGAAALVLAGAISCATAQAVTSQAATPQATASQAVSWRPTLTPDGAVHVQPFAFLPSEFSSKEVQQGLRARANASSQEAFVGTTIAEMRAHTEQQVAPMVAAMRARYGNAVKIEERAISGVRTQIFTPVAGEADRSRVLINLHGGGFMMCAGGCPLLESMPIAAEGRYKVVSVDYRQAPEHMFPAATEDVAAVYRELLKTYRPENIGIYGCSAGGILSGQAAAYFQQKRIPAPGAIGIFGAGAMRMGGDSAYFGSYLDGGFPPPSPEGRSSIVLPYFANVDMSDAQVSPALHPDVIAKFPPTLLITATRAIDLSPAVYTHSQLVKAGVDSQLIVGEGMGHCYMYNPEIPEAQDAYDTTTRFFKTHLGQRATR